jgi:hypothetical protein
MSEASVKAKGFDRIPMVTAWGKSTERAASSCVYVWSFFRRRRAKAICVAWSGIATGMRHHDDQQKRNSKWPHSNIEGCLCLLSLVCLRVHYLSYPSTMGKPYQAKRKSPKNASRKPTSKPRTQAVDVVRTWSLNCMDTHCFNLV